MYLADKHNFGQQVEKIIDETGIWYRKPRSVYWEWLFFGKNSPLKKVFNKEGRYKKLFSDYLFNLELKLENEWSGISKEIPTFKGEISLEHFYSYGLLLAFCYSFGIKDIHMQNMIISETHLQPIDVEIVLATLKFANQTLLLPFKKMGYEFAGLGALVRSKDDLTSLQIQQILFGYCDLFNLLISEKEKLITELDSLNLTHRPIRIVVRSTSDYAEFAKKLPDDVLPSEILQINRGDIPYFFGFLGDANLYWLRTLNQKESETKLFSQAYYNETLADYKKFQVNEFVNKRMSDATMLSGLKYLLNHFNKVLILEAATNCFIENNKIILNSKEYIY